MITIHRQRWFEFPLRTRLPFRYGIAVMTDVPHVWIDLEVTIDGRRSVGRAADHLPPKWFTKDPARAVGEELAEMRAVLTQAARHAAGLTALTVHDAVRALEQAQRDTARQQGWPPLLAHFGTSLVERALLDAACRAAERPLAEVVRGGLGLRLEDFHPELAGAAVADALPATPLARVVSRHTVGLGDPLTREEAPAAEGPNDGLPVSLVDAIRRYGLRHFKIKVTSEPSGLERLERVVAVLDQETRGHFAASLDGNETFTTAEAFRAFWETAQERRRLASLWPRLLFVEQPFHREIALGADVQAGLQAWANRPPLIIDESGAEPEDLRRALAIGYVGVSHKNCKGVLHGIANACLLARRREEAPHGCWLMSGEDLSNVGPVALLQDLAVQALLGNDTVERNGHHYFAGLSAWPEVVQAYALSEFPSLYQRSPHGWPAVRITAGEMDLGEVNERAWGAPVMAPIERVGTCWLEV